MRKKTKMLTILASIITTSTISSMIVKNNTHTQCLNISDKLNDKKNSLDNSNNNVATKTCKAGLIGADKGTFTIEYTDVDHCKIISVSKDFHVKFEFNFHGGKFVDNGIVYTISEIGEKVFYVTDYQSKHFKQCVVTIPSTIKKIGDYAFYNNTSEQLTKDGIICILFEDNGVEYIGSAAFAALHNVEDYSNILILPNSLKYVANNAFAASYPIWDLTKLDHVIETNGEMKRSFTDNKGKYYENACFILKDQNMKNEYRNDSHYSTLFKDNIIIAEGEKKIHVSFSNFILQNKKVSYSSTEYVTEHRFRLEYSTKNDCKFYSVDSDFVIEKGDFSFNHGQFIVSGLKFVITEIGERVFDEANSNKHFHDVYLTIPSTIKKIGDWAFGYCQRAIGKKEIRAINFEEGVEEIGDCAFAYCADIIDKTIKLPNSLKSLPIYAFYYSKVKAFDLSSLDHVISITNVDGKNPYKDNAVDKIYVKDEAMRTKYLADKSWSKLAKHIYVK